MKELRNLYIEYVRNHKLAGIDSDRLAGACKFYEKAYVSLDANEERMIKFVKNVILGERIGNKVEVADITDYYIEFVKWMVKEYEKYETYPN